jgi:hypothetical protein
MATLLIEVKTVNKIIMKNSVSLSIISALFLSSSLLLFLTCKKQELQEPKNLPVSNAGPDQLIILPANSAMLDGTLSSDAQGKIKFYNWTKISGPATYSIDSATAPKTFVKNLVHGVYEFELKVTDDRDLSSTDTVKVILDNAPVAKAGQDQTITLMYCDDNSTPVVLDGSASYDPDSSVLTYSWREIAGPVDLPTTNQGPKNEFLGTIPSGTYSFELTVWDPEGSNSKDTVNFTIKGAPTAYNLDITINSVYSFTDSVELGSGFYSYDSYFYYTSSSGTTNFSPLGNLTINLSERADTAALSNGHTTSIYTQFENNYNEFITGSCSVNFKQLINNGGGSFNGLLTIVTGSATGCDSNALNSLVPLQVAGSLNKATRAITMTIKGKVYF